MLEAVISMVKTAENPMIEEIIKTIDQAFEGDIRAMEELKEITAFVKEVLPILETIEKLDGPEEIKNALQKMADDYERLLLEVFRAVG